MNRKLLADLDRYFRDKTEPTAQEKELMEALEREKPSFCIVYIDRLAVKCCNFRGDRLSDNDMDKIAKKVSRLYCSTSRSGDISKACEEFGLKKNPGCPICGNPSIYDSRKKTYHCESCSQEWGDSYTLVEFPEDVSYFEENDVGYPSFESEDNGARYVSEYDYIAHFKKPPAPNWHFKPLRWPESQPHLFPDKPDESVDALCEPIGDEKGIADFGEQAVWVPLCNIKN